MSKPYVSSELKDLCSGLVLEDYVLKQYMKLFARELKEGLGSNNAAMNCYITFIQKLPTGKERGNFLALDFSGIVVKVILISLKKLSFDLRSKQYIIPTSMLEEAAQTLFNFIAKCLYDFTKCNKVNGDGLPLGFSFGFPCDQKDIKSGVLREWTKGFNCPGAVGKDVVVLLENAIREIPDLKIKVCVLLNDATGILLTSAWKMRDTKIGVVLDTGSNICYMEKIKHVPKYRSSTQNPLVIINTEYSNMGSDGKMDFLRTGWDKEMDESTLNPNRHVLEKMISSLYLGELVRRVLVTAIERNIILRGVMTDEIRTIGAFDTTYMIDVSKNMVQSLPARHVLAQLGYAKPWTQDCADLQYVCDMIWQRAANLAAANIAAVINHINDPEMTIGVDGTFYRVHNGFAHFLEEKVRQLLKYDTKIEMSLTDDGVMMGAALAAATICGKSEGEVGAHPAGGARRRTKSQVERDPDSSRENVRRLQRENEGDRRSRGSFKDSEVPCRKATDTEGRGRDGDRGRRRDRNKYSERDREGRDIDGTKERDSEMEKERDRVRVNDRDRERRRASSRDRDKERDRESERDRDRDIERGKTTRKRQSMRER